MEDQAQKLREIVSTSGGSKEDSKPTIISFTSGKGGVGKTNLAINVAVLLAKQGFNALILDADLSLANVDLLFGISPKFNIKDVILGDKPLKEIIVEGPYGVKIIPASSGVEQLADLGDEKRDAVIKSFKELEEKYDFIFIDTAAGITKTVRNFVLTADEVVIITTPELTALADAYAMIKVVANNRFLPSIKVIVNMVRTKTEADETIERVSLVSSKFLGVKIENFGFVYTDDSVPEAVARQSPFVISLPYSRASNCIKIIANKIKAFKQVQRDKKSLFERIYDVSKEAKSTSGGLAQVPGSPASQTQMKTVRKSELVQRVGEKTDIETGKLELLFDILFDSISSALAQNEEVRIRGFGVFRIKIRKERKYYDFRTLKLELAPTRKYVQFSPSAALLQEDSRELIS